MKPLSELPTERRIEGISVSQDVHYNWAYDTRRAKLMRLYENAKRDQWNGNETTSDVDQDIEDERRLRAGESLQATG